MERGGSPWKQAATYTCTGCALHNYKEGHLHRLLRDCTMGSPAWQMKGEEGSSLSSRLRADVCVSITTYRPREVL